MTDAEGTGLAVHGLAGERGGRRLFAGLDFAVALGGALVLRGANGAPNVSMNDILEFAGKS